jgi:hypothetical protein
MTIEKLIKYCLQYLEQGSETDIMQSSISDLVDDDTFAEYIRNIEHSIYMGLTRYASSNALKIAEYEVPKGESIIPLVENKTRPETGKTVKKRMFHKIKEIYAENENKDIVPSVDYFVIGDKVKIKNFKENYKYYILYYPTIYELEFYMTPEDTDIYSIELDELGVTDEMAINLKYLVYSELKLEENPNLANTNKNYFETYLESLNSLQVYNNQTSLVNRMNPDTEAEACSSAYSREWSDIYGD